MCSITILPRGVRVSPEISEGLRNAAEVNTDGAGFGIVTENGVLHQRSMDAEALTEAFALAREQWSKCTAVIHYRLATQKKADATHLHPFECGNGRFLFFNGSLPELERAGRSDARVLAEDIVSKIRSDDLDLSARIGPRDKAVVLEPGDALDPHCYVGNSDQWIKGPEGTWWSNQDFAGKGWGWDEAYSDEGDLLRWNKFWPGQCQVCHRFACKYWDSGAYEPEEEGSLKVVRSPATYRTIAMSRSEGEHCYPAATLMPRWRNETARIAGLS